MAAHEAKSEAEQHGAGRDGGIGEKEGVAAWWQVVQQASTRQGSTHSSQAFTPEILDQCGIWRSNFDR